MLVIEKRLRIFLVFLLVSSFFWISSAYPAEPRCKSALADFFRRLPIVLTPLQNSPRLLFWDGATHDITHGFPTSNEFDYYFMPFDDSPTDIVLGFGTNSAWDIAVRKNAKALVIADWLFTPLDVQEYLFRSLFKIAGSPSEFLFLLAGLDPDPTLQDLPIEKTFRAIDRHWETLTKSSAFPSARIESVKRLLRRVESSEPETSKQVYYISGYFEGFYRGLSARDRIPPYLAGSISKNAINIRRDYIWDLYDFFRERYDPTRLLKEGADRELVSNPFYSFLSSQAAFDRLKKLFAENIYYINGDLRDRRVFERLKQFGDSKGFRSYAVSGSNILDCHSDGEKHFPQELARQFYTMTSVLNPTKPCPLTFYQTRGTNERHRYERYILEEVTEKPLVRDFSPDFGYDNSFQVLEIIYLDEPHK